MKLPGLKQPGVRKKSMKRQGILGLMLCTLMVFVANGTSAQRLPEICTGKQSCFMTFDGPERGFCQAYVEGKSCFMSMEGPVNIGWCQYLLEGKSCFMALDGKARKECEAGRIPKEHRHWLRLCHRKGRDRSS
ncbi:MAG: hypothetical protein AAF637_10660 [Pseudomonadota bacterium]